MSGPSREACECCGYLTVPPAPRSPGFVCPVCFWQEEPDDGRDPNRLGVVNHVSLLEARSNYSRFGAAEPRFEEHVRPPRPDEGKR
jgi:hypothetical protein